MSTGDELSFDDASFVAAASDLTREKCSLLGVKSIGVDYGLVRTGLAMTVGFSPEPLTILKDVNSTRLCENIVEKAKVHQVSRLVVGLPLHKNGTIAEQTNLTLIFADELNRMVLTKLGSSVSVELFDERYTSKEAASRIRSKHPGQALQGILDADAACIILENYYNENGEGSQPIPITQEIREQCLKDFEMNKAATPTGTQSDAGERDLRILRRKQAIERDLKLQLEQQGDKSATGKKKKKRKRKR